MSMRRFTRLTNAFSRKRDNLRAALALHFAAYNFTWMHRTIRCTPAMAAGMRTQLSGLAALVPIGVVLPWFKDIPGVPALGENFVECNGQQLVDPESPLDGQFMPDINTGAQRFIRGGPSSGTVGGISDFATAQADNAGVGTAQNFVTTDFSPGAQPFPPYVTAVYVIRVK
jgi:hypothetical protein